MRRTVIAIGSLQCLALLVFAVAIVVNAQRVNSTVGKPVVEAIIFATFGVCIGFLSWGFSLGRAWTRTPLALLQVFAGIVGYTLLAGSGQAAHAAGAAVSASALIALVALFRAA
jgi:uncharacterized protein YacL